VQSFHFARARRPSAREGLNLPESCDQTWENPKSPLVPTEASNDERESACRFAAPWGCSGSMTDHSPPVAHPLEPTLPRDAYISPAIFAAERERIFAREWVLVGREESVLAPGDYFDVDVLGESVLVVRGDDGALRAFFNVCRHRGSALVPRAAVDPANEGVPVVGCKGATIRCPYHSWVYGLDGSLKSAPYLEPALEGRKHEFGRPRGYGSIAVLSPQRLLLLPPTLEGAGRPPGSMVGCRSLLFFDLQPQLDQPADGFGAAGKIVLPASPIVNDLQRTSCHADRDRLAIHWRAAALGFFNVIYS